MRFKNLTITLTLTCFFIVALAGLVLLPITNVICESDFYGGSWTYSNDNTQASYNAKHYGEHWSLSSTIDARGVSVSVSVSPFDIWDWTEPDRLKGTATVTARREDSSIWDLYYHPSWGADDCSFQLIGFCLGHRIQRVIPGSGIYTRMNEVQMLLRVILSSLTFK